MNPFKAADALTSAACDAAFGERLRHIPWLPAEYTAGEADPDRSPADYVGIFSSVTAVANPGGNKAGRGGDNAFRGERLPAQQKSATFDLSLFPSKEYWPRKGDRLVQLDESGYPRFEVVSAIPDGMNRIRVVVVGPE